MHMPYTLWRCEGGKGKPFLVITKLIIPLYWLNDNMAKQTRVIVYLWPRYDKPIAGKY